MHVQNSNLYSSFITPWSDSKTVQALNIEPEYHLSSSYNVQPPPAQSKIGNFSDETLFFIFYSQPKDLMQEMAAHELYVVFLLSVYSVYASYHSVVVYRVTNASDARFFLFIFLSQIQTQLEIP